MLIIITEKLHAIQKAILFATNEICVAINEKKIETIEFTHWRNFEAEKKNSNASVIKPNQNRISIKSIDIQIGTILPRCKTQLKQSFFIVFAPICFQVYLFIVHK